MNILIFTLSLVFLSGFGGAVLGNYFWHRKEYRWTFRVEDIDEETKSITIEPEKEPGQAEFIEDSSQDELEELEQPKLWKFLNQFKRK